MKNKAQNIIRWVALLPVATISLVIAYLLFLWGDGVAMGYHGMPGWVNKYVIPVFSAGFGGVVYMWVVVCMAPKYKQEVAIVMLVLLSMAVSLTLFVGIYYESYLGAIQAAAVVVSAVVAFFSLRDNNFELT